MKYYTVVIINNDKFLATTWMELKEIILHKSEEDRSRKLNKGQYRVNPQKTIIFITTLRYSEGATEDWGTQVPIVKQDDGLAKGEM